eukprot:4929581-Amphidinium_carterae.1
MADLLAPQPVSNSTTSRVAFVDTLWGMGEGLGKEDFCKSDVVVLVVTTTRMLRAPRDGAEKVRGGLCRQKC